MTEPNPWSREAAEGPQQSSAAPPHGPPAPEHAKPADPEPADPEPADPKPDRAWSAGSEQPTGSSVPLAAPAADSWPAYPPGNNPASSYPAPYAETGYPYPYGATGYPYPYGATGYPVAQPGADYGPGASAYGAMAAGPYPYPSGPYGRPATTHPQAVASLVLGVIGLVICAPAGVAGFFVAHKARKEIIAEPQRYGGLGLATAGWILGIVAIVLTSLMVLFVMIGLAGGWDS